MTIQEALASGKPFRRVAVGGAFFTNYEEYSRSRPLSASDIVADDYELKPEPAFGFTESSFAEAWDVARVGTAGVRQAGQTDFYKRLMAELKRRSAAQ